LLIKKNILLFLFLPSLSIAQICISGKITDAKTKEAVPFANIENFRTKTGTQSNQDGAFVFDMPNGKRTDTLKISCIGYLDRFVTDLTSSSDVSYALTPVVFQLKEVAIGKSKSKEVEVGVFTKSGRKFKILNQRFQNSGLQNAVYIKNSGYESAYIEKLHFFMGDDMFEAPFRVHIYENDNGSPGKDLLEENLTYSAVKKNSWNAFDVSLYSIIVPQNGFWVAVEWIANDRYKKTEIYDVAIPNHAKSKGSYTYYGPEIVAHFDTDFGLTYYKYLASKKWYKRSGSSSIGLSKRMRPVNIDLLVKATLKIYE